MRITLIVSAYNRPDMLAKALLSASAGSRPPDEAVVTDDGSRVDMVGPLRNLLPRLAFPVKYVTQADTGFRLARARNNAVRIATGDLLVSTDQDIIFSPRFIETYEENARPGRFMVSYPVRLTEEQTGKIDEAGIKDFSFMGLITEEQRAIVRKQRRKDAFYSALKMLGLRRIGPKLRGGVFAVRRSDFLAVNGFDERYVGWGNEDDDLGHRLGAYGVTGLNPFRDEFPIHLHHPTHAGPVHRPNREYYLRRLKEITRRDYRSEHGIDTPLGDDLPIVIEL